MSSEETDRFYAGHASEYAAAGSHRDNRWRDAFLSGLAPAAAILELGCGGGYDSAAMIACGFSVTPTDGVAEMAEQAQKRLGVPVQVLRFDAIDYVSAFDGIWASACLLHVPRADLPVVLQRIHAALKPGGLFYASFKAGEGEGQDSLSRYYNYPDTVWLREAYAVAPWASVEIEEMDGLAYDKRPTRWLHVFARAA